MRNAKAEETLTGKHWFPIHHTLPPLPHGPVLHWLLPLLSFQCWFFSSVLILSWEEKRAGIPYPNSYANQSINQSYNAAHNTQWNFQEAKGVLKLPSNFGDGLERQTKGQTE